MLSLRQDINKETSKRTSVNFEQSFKQRNQSNHLLDLDENNHGYGRTHTISIKLIQLDQQANPKFVYN